MARPVIGLNDSGGARIQEGVASLAGYAEIFLRNTLASGVIPQLSAIMGPCAGAAGLFTGDHGFYFHDSRDFVHVRYRPGRHQDSDSRGSDQAGAGGAQTHNATSGVAHFISRDDADCCAMLRELLGFLPSNNLEDPPRRPSSDPIDRREEKLNQIVPEDPQKPYDMKDVIHAIVDEGYFF